MAADSLFRKNVLQRLYSPDQLDQLLRITSPRSWLLLLGLLLLLAIFILWGIFGSIDTRITSKGIILSKQLHPVLSGHEGKLVRLLVEPGDTVDGGDAIAFIEKIEGEGVRRDTLRSMTSGHVVQVSAVVGEEVRPETTVVQIEEKGEEFDVHRVTLFLPLQEGKKVKEGMEVEVAPATVEPEEHGYIAGTVSRVSELPATKESMINLLHNDLLAEFYEAKGAPFVVEVELSVDSTSPSGYKWMSGRGPEIRIGNGTPVSARIRVATQRPVDLVIPGIAAE